MSRKRRIISEVELVDIGAKGKTIGKKDGIVYLVEGGVPGDVVTIETRRKRKGLMEAKTQSIEKQSPYRADPFCDHFEHCGGCNWQHLAYTNQLSFKEHQVLNQMRRIGGFKTVTHEHILGSDQITHYRNKLEFTFVDQRWLTPEEIKDPSITKSQGLGFHVPGRFDWILHIEECHLQDDMHNQIRNYIFSKSIDLGISFFQPRTKEGILRNLVLRNNRKGEWMLLLIVSEKSSEVRALCDLLSNRFKEITSLWLIENKKVNDDYSDCPAELVVGVDHLMEVFQQPDEKGEVSFRIGPKSFFQTNPNQAEKLYQLVYEWAEVDPSMNVYDLYTGTGSIALFIANQARQVVGIEYVPEAIKDAKINAELNAIKNTHFYAGDMKDVFSDELIAKHGSPNVLITDPPRAGMHEDVVMQILKLKPKRIVYVSCDPATQARDLALLKESYDLVKIRPVDMFPHTSHVENVALLSLRP